MYRSCPKHKPVTATVMFHWLPFVRCSVYNEMKLMCFSNQTEHNRKQQYELSYTWHNCTSAICICNWNACLLVINNSLAFPSSCLTLPSPDLGTVQPQQVNTVRARTRKWKRQLFRDNNLRSEVSTAVSWRIQSSGTWHCVSGRQ